MAAALAVVEQAATGPAVVAAEVQVPQRWDDRPDAPCAFPRLPRPADRPHQPRRTARRPRDRRDLRRRDRRAGRLPRPRRVRSPVRRRVARGAGCDGLRQSRLGRLIAKTMGYPVMILRT